VYQALAGVLPERVIADSGGSPALRVQFSGHTATDEPFALLLFASAGMGASAHHDGLPTTAFPTNSGGGSIEALESSAPLLFTKKEFRADSGGAGTHRGGLGQDIEVRNTTSTALRVILLGDRARHPALGVNGGSAGEAARVIGDDGTPLDLKSVTALAAGAGLTISFAGGGGYGPPSGRPPSAIAADLREGFITHEAAVRDYGVDAVTAGHGR
jgi:N-methylhydantoinase B